ncbi:MAG TPA: CAP domain-containing protein [Noviherbaspirillum sp.]
MGRLLRQTLPALITVLILAACGGGGGSSPISQPAASTATQEPNAPQATGNTATDGLNWFNFRRQQLGLSELVRNTKIDAAAQSHSSYQEINNVITHDEDPNKQGFTGVTTSDRLKAAGYLLPSNDYAYGEVISSTSDSSGFHAAEDLIAAIYHRFLVFEPMFKEGGAGAATVSGGLTYFTANFAAIGLNTGLRRGQVLVYPFPDQQRVPASFFSNNESPDPVPNRNEVGYPISVHANITSTLAVSSFTVTPRGGTALPVQLLTGTPNPDAPNQSVDIHTPASAAAIIPLQPLSAATTYDVQFTGSVDGKTVSRSWSFTTQ